MRRFLQSLSPIIAMVLILAGARTYLHAQAAMPAPNADKRPHLSLWAFPGMVLHSDKEMPTLASMDGISGSDYASVFDFYVKKFGGDRYDLKQLTTFQPPDHALTSGVSTDMNATSCCYIDSQTMQATFSRRTEHEYISVFLIRARGSHMTDISMTATTF